jgi:hypothetical protein
MHFRLFNSPETALDGTFQQAFGSVDALTYRSNSFHGTAKFLPAAVDCESSSVFILKGLRTAFGLLYIKADEVARNGVLQRITSARGFLGHPLLKA